MTDEITKEINTFHWTNTASSIFFVFTPIDYALTEGTCLSGGLPGLGGGLECSYHETVGGYNYAAMNYEGSNPPAGCDTGDGNPTDTMINEASHEQFEAITNPKEYFYNPGNGWNNSDCNSVLGVNACEMADKCEASSQSGVVTHPRLYLNGNTYPGVQGEFSNATGACEYTIAPAYPVVDVPGGGAFRTVWLSTGDVNGPLGDPIDSWYSIPGGQKQDFVGGSIYWSSATGTDEVQGAIYTEYTSGFGGPSGGLGFPTSVEVGIAGGRVSYFYGNLCGARGPDNSGAAIYWTSGTGAHQVGGCIYNHYWSVLGGPAGDGYHNLGFPTSNVLDISGGYVSYFYGMRSGASPMAPTTAGVPLLQQWNRCP